MGHEDVSNIEHALKSLDWSLPELQQVAARRYLVAHIGDDLSPLMVANLYKVQFENAALVLAEIGHPRIDAYIEPMLVWFQDRNWPGAQIIAKLLMGGNTEVLLQHLNLALKQAADIDDDGWIYFLQEFKEEILQKNG
ncbi:DUF5071 domain-containing protein [Profundibacter sp.]